MADALLKIPGMVYGTYREARQMIGYVTPARRADITIDRFMVTSFCGLIQDANSAFWSSAAPEDAHTAHPAMLLSYILPLPWSPGSGGSHYPLHIRVPLPGSATVNRSQEVRFHRPLKIGQRLAYTEELVDVSELKSTVLGRGHFITTRTMFYVELPGSAAKADEAIAEQVNTLFRYEPTTAS